MKPPILIRPFTPEERNQVEAGLRSKNAFLMRRCQILMASSNGKHSFEIEKSIGCSNQTVRNVIKAFNLNGSKALESGRHGPHHTRAVFSPEQIDRLKQILLLDPLDYGKPSHVWTLGTLAEISLEQGLTTKLAGIETMRATLERNGIRWDRELGWVIED